MNQRTIIIDMLQEISTNELGDFAIGFTCQGRRAIDVHQGYQKQTPLFSIDVQNDEVRIVPGTTNRRTFCFDIRDPEALETVKEACIFLVKFILLMPTLDELMEKNYPKVKIVEGYQNEGMMSESTAKGPGIGNGRFA